MAGQLENVNVAMRGNIYFDGKVTSRTVYTKDGEKKTLGIILPGTYELGVGDREIVHVLAGKAEVLLPPDKKEWKAVGEGENFTVVANSTYGIRCCQVVEYLCEYFPDK